MAADWFDTQATTIHRRNERGGLMGGEIPDRKFRVEIDGEVVKSDSDAAAKGVWAEYDHAVRATERRKGGGMATTDYEGTARSTNFSTSPAVMDERAREIRIEALQAAAQIAPAIISSDEDVARVAREDTPIATKAILAMAKDFAKWLETGEG